MLSPPEGHWKVEVSFPQTPNQCQSNHTGTELLLCEEHSKYGCREERLVCSTYSQASGGKGGRPSPDRWGVCIHECPGKILLEPLYQGRGSWKGQRRGYFQWETGANLRFA